MAARKVAELKVSQHCKETSVCVCVCADIQQESTGKMLWALLKWPAATIREQRCDHSECDK